MEPRRADCPWCGGRALVTRLVSPDIVQVKPGSFTLEECRTCGHIFQNPRLTAEGLEFYYRDMYDGLGEKDTERVFRFTSKIYRRRARMVRRHASPRTWLDIGTGYGHFCRTARTILPDTRFDGLDLGAGVLKAQRRGWITHAYQGLFPELADRLPDPYDVVSMHHYLEHTVDPRREIATAAAVLRPGGLLIIEVPDPGSIMGRLLGRYWVPWFQPQHLHLMPLDNLTAALTDAGFQVVAVERQKADIGHDFVLAALVAINLLGPRPRRPWKDGPVTPVDRARFTVAMALMPAALLTGFVLDLTVRPLLPRRSNAYRVLAAAPRRGRP
ncbi:class I SAM-dependent methyltransferase [Actinomadura napierensis]|uniref:Class I SAM-dependent methyltransferase n=1 Tax=Actinomadura napierensis TaxID=267854 RepID=A0ABP5KMD3_9ACTN